MSAERPTCPACGAAVAAIARFCGACGARCGEAPPPPPPPAPRVPARRRTRSSTSRTHAAVGSGRLWRRLLPALQLWIGLLAINGLLGLAGHVVDLGSPWWDVGATLASIGLIAAFAAADREPLWRLLRDPGLTDRTWWHPLVVGAALFAFATFYFVVLERIGVRSHGYLDDFLDAQWPVWTAFVLIAVCPAFIEEIAFRGFILGRLDEVMSPRDALLVQAAMFSVLHMAPAIYVSHFVFGLAFGILRRSTGSLAAGIVVHAAWNAWVVIEELVAAPA